MLMKKQQAGTRNTRTSSQILPRIPERMRLRQDSLLDQEGKSADDIPLASIEAAFSASLLRMFQDALTSVYCGGSRTIVRSQFI
jgi:hypothetical protein